MWKYLTCLSKVAFPVASLPEASREDGLDVRRLGWESWFPNFQLRFSPGLTYWRVGGLSPTASRNTAQTFRDIFPFIFFLL